MSDFHAFNARLQAHVDAMCKNVTHLFTVDLDADKLWETYLENIPSVYNPFFRKRRLHECNGCRHFFRHYGNLVSIQDGKLVTIWDFDAQSDEYQPAIDAAAAFVRQHAITNVFIPESASMGIEQNNGLLDDAPHVYYHLHTTLPEHILSQSGLQGTNHADTRRCFQRALEELSLDSLQVVNEWICVDRNLYRGDEWEECIRKYLELKPAYHALRSAEARDLFCWMHSARLGESWGRLLNRAIGALLIDLTGGMDLEKARRRYEKATAPANYRRPKPAFTAKMLEEAQKAIEALGFTDSLPRRHAVPEDVPAEELLYRSREAVPPKANVSGVFADMLSMAAPSRKPAAPVAGLERVERISYDRFIRDVLPTARELEIKLEPRHAANMVSLLAPVNPQAPSMYKWRSPFNWAYADNMADANIRENVKAAGGRVDGVLRFSIQWNDGGEFNQNDFDAHCRLPGFHIYYPTCPNHRLDPRTGGNLDVDIIHPQPNVPAVENITWPSKARMVPGDYVFSVHCYSNRGGQSGFKGEIEFDGQVYPFEYPHACTEKQEIIIGTVNLSASGQFTYKPNLASGVSSHIWGVPTNEFTPVTMVMKSPNHWGKGEGVGHLHYFFILKDCISPEESSGYYNEFMCSDLSKHSRVIEGMSEYMKVAPSDRQVSGVGFSVTQENDVIVRVTGVTRRQFLVQF